MGYETETETETSTETEILSTTITDTFTQPFYITGKLTTEKSTSTKTVSYTGYLPPAPAPSPSFTGYLPPAPAPAAPNYLPPSSDTTAATTPNNNGIYFQSIDSLADVADVRLIEGSLEPDFSPQESAPTIIHTPALPAAAWYAL